MFESMLFEGKRANELNHEERERMLRLYDAGFLSNVVERNVIMDLKKDAEYLDMFEEGYEIAKITHPQYRQELDNLNENKFLAGGETVWNNLVAIMDKEPASQG